MNFINNVKLNKFHFNFLINFKYIYKKHTYITFWNPYCKSIFKWISNFSSSQCVHNAMSPFHTRFDLAVKENYMFNKNNEKYSSLSNSIDLSYYETLLSILNLIVKHLTIITILIIYFGTVLCTILVIFSFRKFGIPSKHQITGGRISKIYNPALAKSVLISIFQLWNIPTKKYWKLQIKLLKIN